MTLEKLSMFLRSKMQSFEAAELTFDRFGGASMVVPQAKRWITRDDKTYVKVKLEARDVPQLIDELLEEGSIDPYQPIVMGVMKNSRLLKYVKDRDQRADLARAQEKARVLDSRPRPPR
jgi:hypothetical protein